jgi:bacterioferritin-associated ferredoxin
VADGKIVVCLCHDVTEHDLVAAFRAGYTHPETLKRFTGCLMGPCQGRYCASTFLVIFKALSGKDGSRPSVRAPLGVVRLGQLADGDSRGLASADGVN